jgi:hypothetical protein
VPALPMPAANSRSNGRAMCAVPKRGLFKRGDLFEIILIQVKGGSAALPLKQ